MHRYLKIITGAVCYVTLSIASAGTLYQRDGYNTPLDAAQYRQTVIHARLKVQHLLHSLQPYRALGNNAQIAFIAQQLAGTPYIFHGATGEGDWQPSAATYQPGAVHIDQNPVYRFDGLDCQTFVQDAIGLLHATTLAEFDNTMLKTAYGAAGNPQGERVHYFNRNNFTDGDWNPINQHNGWLTDVTTQPNLAPYTLTLTATITRQNWFLQQQKNVDANITVLNDASRPLMIKRLMTIYSHLNYPHFDKENITINYIPKEKIALQQNPSGYQPNISLLEKIPTPAVAEIIRDPKKWFVNGKIIQAAIGSETTVSHLGLLYRQTFKKSELIYQKISCHLNQQNNKVCIVIPVTCNQRTCSELMFAHATDSHPDGYYWYQDSDKHFQCSATLPAQQLHYTHCNRVEALPLFDYLTEYQYGAYWYMDNPGLLGVHIEYLR